MTEIRIYRYSIRDGYRNRKVHARNGRNYCSSLLLHRLPLLPVRTQHPSICKLVNTYSNSRTVHPTSHLHDSVIVRCACIRRRSRRKRQQIWTSSAEWMQARSISRQTTSRLRIEHFSMRPQIAVHAAERVLLFKLNECDAPTALLELRRAS